MSPAAAALDRRLYELRSTRDAVASSLLDLESDETFAALVAGDGLSGATAARAEHALARLARLRHGLSQVDELLARISSLRDTNQIDHGRAIELVAQLNSTSVAVPAERTATHMVSAQGLLSALDDTLTSLREVVAEAASVRRELLQRFERAAARADRLEAELPDFAPVAEVQATLVALPGRIAADPLGTAEELARVEEAITEAAQARDEMARVHDAIAKAGPLLDELEALLGEGHDALRRSRAEIAHPHGLLDPVDPEVLTGERGLRPWLARLERLLAEGDLLRAGKGLARWQQLADQTLAAARQVAEANAHPVRRRHELLGLLRAAEVKAGASGRAEDPVVTELAGLARRALAVPCDLGAAEARVEAYLDELRRTPTPAQASAGIG